MDTNHQLAELDALLISGFDAISAADIATADDATVLLDKAIRGVDHSVDPGEQFDSLFKNAHIEPNRAGDSLAKRLEKDLDAILKPVPVRSTTAPATVALSDEQVNRALDKAEDNRELSGMTRWLAGQLWHGKNARDLIAHARQSDPVAAGLMEQAAVNLGVEIALQL